MGKVRTKDIKTASWKLFEKYPDKFTKDFGDNKKSLNSIIKISEKKARNKIAGYLVRIVRQKNDSN